MTLRMKVGALISTKSLFLVYLNLPPPSFFKAKLVYHIYFMRKLLPWLVSFTCNSSRSKNITYNNNKRYLLDPWIRQALYSAFYIEWITLNPLNQAGFLLKGQIVKILAL